MSGQSIPLGPEFGSQDSDPADPMIANLQQSVNLANENCDRAVLLAQTLSAQLREAQDRVNQLEREAEILAPVGEQRELPRRQWERCAPTRPMSSANSLPRPRRPRMN